MKAYKGFDKNMKCRSFRYKEGGEYETDRAEVCESGFHACENPLDCLNYYAPGEGSVYHEVELDGQIDKRNDGDTKVAATKIKIGAKLSIAEIIKGAITFVFSKTRPTTGYYYNSATTTYCSPSATMGDYSPSATTGGHSPSATTGGHSPSATTGYHSNSATTGDFSNSEVKGKDSIAAVLGCNCKARGGLGCWLVLTERDLYWHILGVQAIRIDGEKYKPDVWYELHDGKVVEAED